MAPHPPTGIANKENCCAPSASWRIELLIPPGLPHAGSYRGTLRLLRRGASIWARVDDWSNGARSLFAGQWSGQRLQLQRVDIRPYAGFRASFVGELGSLGKLRGSFWNDPNAPHGNSAIGTWIARPLKRQR